MLTGWRPDAATPASTLHPRDPQSSPVTVAFAAAHARLPRRTVARWVAEGLLPADAGSPRRPRVHLSDVDTLTGPPGRGSDEADERLWTPASREM